MGLLNNLYIFVYADVKNKLATYRINDYDEFNDYSKNISQSSIKQLVNVINNSTHQKIVLVCRSKDEPYTQEFPAQLYLDYIKKNSKKNIKVFYQNPLPAKVPNFEDDYMIIRFGWDSGCEFDNAVGEDKLFDTELSDGSYTLLYNNNKSINLNKKSIL